MKNKDFTEYSLTSSGQQSLEALGESSEIISRKALAISCILKGVTVSLCFHCILFHHYTYLQSF